MSLLDIYLQRNGKKRYDVFKETGLSQQMLASVNKKAVASYSVKTVQAIAQTVGKSEGIVLEELLNLENEKPVFEVYNSADLLQALENKETYISIKKEFKEEMEDLAETQLSETATLGAELGSAGLVSVLAEGFYKLGNLFSKQDEERKKIESQLRRYNIKRIGKEEFLLSLKQLDY